MDILTLAGIVLGCLLIGYNIVIDDGMAALARFYNLGGIFIVFGGVLSAGFVAYPMEVLKTVPKAIGLTFKKNNDGNIQKDLDMIIEIANVARREGILALEETVKGSDDVFLKKGIMLIIDGSDPELVRSIMETELDFISDRHNTAIGVLETLSAWAPAFGMIGTVIGLINMLGNLSDPDALGPGMSVAMITTFYGAFVSNLVLTPMSRKLRVHNSAERRRKELILEGILSIQDGENPRIIREKLNAFLPQSEVQKMAATEAKAE